MRKISVFNFMTLNGFYKGPNEDISWHKQGPQEGEVAAEGLKSENTLLFGRVTYEMMANYWSAPMAEKDNPAVAEGMNKAQKFVFSKTLKAADWENTKVISGNIFEEIKKMKQAPGNDMTILGSGSIVSQFTDQGLIDEYMFMVDPIAIGEGTSVFKNISQVFRLKLTNSKIFKSGIVLLTYQPA